MKNKFLITATGIIIIASIVSMVSGNLKTKATSPAVGNNENKPGTSETTNVEPAKDVQNPQLSSNTEEKPSDIIKIGNGVEDLELKAKINNLLKKETGYFSVGIKDLETGNTVYINDTQLKAASVIKVFVMEAAYEKAKEGKLDLNKKIVLKNSMKVGGTGSLQGMKEGTIKTIDQLIEMMITISDNIAANIIVKELGFEYINERIKELGCKDTVLGWYFVISGPKGVRNTTSVRDLNLLYEKMYTNNCLGKEYDQKMLGLMKRLPNKTKLPLYLPKDTIVAHKTGAINVHEHDAGIVYGPKKNFIISILSKDFANPETAKKVIGKITKLAYDYYNQ